MVKEECNENELNSNTKYKYGVNKNARLVVRNVSFKATEESLKKYFSQYGTIEELKLLKKPDGKLVGCGFVHFTHVPMANKALAATNKKAFLGRPLYVSWAVSKHKYDQKEDNGDTNLVNTASSDDKKKIKSERSTDTTEQSQENKHRPRINRNARLIIRNVSFKATEEMLREHFTPYGEILEVKLLKKPDGKLVGCGFVHYKNVPMAKKALLNTNMKPFLGRPISVDWAVAKNKYIQHIVNTETEMVEKVKKEETDSDDDDDDDDGPQRISNEEEIKCEIKSESEDSEVDDDSEEDKKYSDSENNISNSEECEDEEMSDIEQKEDMEVVERKRTKLNDAEDGCTVFLTNIPFSVDNDTLKAFVEQTAPVSYALVCVDRLTEHSKGSGFVKFKNKEDTDKFLSLPPDQLKLEGQVMQVKPALKRENLQKKNKKEPKDNRNLYLVKEGVVVAGSAAATGVSASDMSKRLQLERSKTQMLRNLNRFVSRLRLVVSNLPTRFGDAALRRLVVRCLGKDAQVTEARVMRDLRAPPAPDGTHLSKGYGFVMFTRHEDALTCLRKLNNNPEIFDKNNRPIVSFSIEDRTALNARKKRLQKSIENNPLIKKDDDRKRRYNERSNFTKDNKRVKLNRDSEVGRFVRRPTEDATEYSGLTAKAGTPHKIRNYHKLRMQENIHKKNVKLEKKKNNRSLQFKKAAKERVKLPKQKINKNPNKKRRFRNNKLNNSPLDKLL